MIENADEQKTYFVKRGQTLGDVKIEAILKDKVILSCLGQEVELR
jgi:type II secretory pathway component PulC